MAYSGDIEGDSSFSVAIRNNSNSRQVFSMFLLGDVSPEAISVISNPVASEPNNINPYFDINQGGGFGLFTILLIGGTQVYESLAKFNFSITDGGSGTVNINSVANYTDTLQEITDNINTGLTTTIYKYVRVQFAGFPLTGASAPIGGGFDKKRLLLTIMYLTQDPLTGSTAGYFTGDPNDTGNPMLIEDLSFSSIITTGGAVIDQVQTNIRLYTSTYTNTSNNGAIEILKGQGTPYPQILESQSGLVLDVKSMRIDALSDITENVRFQLLEPLTFTKNNANGKEISYNKMPVIDPYQYMNSVDFVKMKSKADTFTFDGQTKFSSALQPNMTVRLSYNYTSLTNLVADTEYGQEMIAKQTQQLAKETEEGDNNRVYNLDIPKSVVSKIEIQNKTAKATEKAKQEQVQKKKFNYKKYTINLSLQAKSLFYCWELSY